MKRRDIIKGAALLPFIGHLPINAIANISTQPPKDLFEELGIKKVINARGTMTYLSGSLMLPEVMEAINTTSHDFANLHEVEDKIGEKIAEMLHCEAAMITSGAAGALSIGTAAVITGKDKKKIAALPHFSGAPPEVIIQKSHRYSFDQAIRMTGAVMVEVEGPEEMERAINKNTVMVHCFNAAEDWFGIPDSISHKDFIAIAKKHNIPAFIDAAADVTPAENLFKFQKEGFDLITFSGGKILRGPQSTGLLFGRKDLIEAAKLNFDPYECPIGRPMKVNKEEMFGMYVALKTFLQEDHKAVWNQWVDRTRQIAAHLKTVPTVIGKTHIPSGKSNYFPGLSVSWDQDRVKITPREVSEKLRNGNPCIEVGGGKEAVHIAVVTLRPDQDAIVAEQLKKILEQAL